MLHGIVGLLALLALAWGLSEDRWRVPFRTVLSGVALQILLALLMTHTPLAAAFFGALSRGVQALQAATDAGTGFVFGYLGGGRLPFAETEAGASFIFAFRALPLVLVISALASLFFYWGILQRIVQGFAWVLRRVMGIGGPLGLGAASHIFVGMIEAPLLIRPYLARMERGDLFALMSCGLAGIAGSVMVLYATILGPIIPDALGNILIASVISTPAALAVAALMVPFPANPAPARYEPPGDPPANALDAIAKGTGDGITILLNIIAVLIVAIALVTLINAGLAGVSDSLSLQGILAYPFRPILWLIGIPWGETEVAARLMATKTVLNEFVAYVDLARLDAGSLSPRSRLIMTYALCGFANFGSLGILVGGLTAMVPERKADIARLGLRALVAGTLATCMSGAVIGML
ncbi:MAG TPA: nucleoside transporter C-terminal domain-containing protein [Stellaceae bacterium]|nr:nucleoside transporter C-terminal domain-containing protein [Stellaceae bacterium]